MEYTSLVNMCVIKPSYQLMQMAYNDYLVDSAPCKGGVTNQCAVRMSIALERCGFSLSAFDPARRVHHGRASCQVSINHVLGANELARYLTRIWGSPERFNGQAGHNAATTLNGRKGIIYFDNCFRRETGGPKTGDHIDLWTGTQYYNQLIHVGAGGDASASATLFTRAEGIWFYPLAA